MSTLLRNVVWVAIDNVYFEKMLLSERASEWVSEKVTSREAIASKNSPLGSQKVKNDSKIK